MAGLSHYAQNYLLNWIKGLTLYVGLFSSDPTDANTGGTEVTTTLRAGGRVAVILGSISNNNAVANTNTVDFGSAAGGATVSHFAFFDAPTAGNKIGSAAITGGAQSVSTGNNVSFAAGALTIVLD